MTHFYDEALKPVDLRASQLALMWAIVACEPVELGKLGDITHTDQTTLSRTVDKLRQAAWWLWIRATTGAFACCGSPPRDVGSSGMPRNAT